MKKTFVILFMLAATLTIYAADAVTIILSDGINETNIKAKMERTIQEGSCLDCGGHPDLRSGRRLRRRRGRQKGGFRQG